MKLSKMFQQMANVRIMGEHKRIAFAAHNEKKWELIECLKKYRDVLLQHKLYGTGTTGSLVQKELGIHVTQYLSGPLGGDQQLGARIAMGELDILIFIIDPLNSHAHEADVEALVRLSRVHNIVCATTTTDVDFILTSEMITKSHTRKVNLVAYPNAKKAT
jgi:methylglyoxal synthase